MLSTVALPDSQHVVWPGATRVGPAQRDAPMSATVWLHGLGAALLTPERAYEIGATLPKSRTYEDRLDLARKTDADAATFARVEEHCAAYGLAVRTRSWRSLSVSGTVDSFSRAFGTRIDDFIAGGGRHLRRRASALYLPPAVAHAVRGVCGLDEWPDLPMTRVHRTKVPVSSDAVSPPAETDALTRYGFPTPPDGTGETIGILRLGGTFHRADFEAGLRCNGVHVPPPVHFVRVDDAANSYGETSKLDTELALDTQIAGSLAPGARLVLYAAPHSERGFLDAIRTALFDEQFRPSVFSISFGVPEVAWTTPALELLDDLFIVAALIGVSIFCASGDSGADVLDGRAHVRAPASSHFVHACGGTQIDAATGVETVWPGSGGGFSERRRPQPEPAWQAVAAYVADELGIARGRGVPDVAAAVIPGYRIVIGGETLLGGGTSAVAPLWAALTARINQQLGVPCGFFAPLLYADAGASRALQDIKSGNNGRFEARDSWDACTGLGTPLGTNLHQLLSRGPSRA